MSFRKLIHEIHRRSLWQVLGIYVAGSWLALQVVETLDSAYGLPEWFPPAALGLLVVGLPIVLATAFIQEGAGREAPAETGAGSAGASGAADAAGAPAGDVSPETSPASEGRAHPARRAGEPGAAAPDVSAETSPTRATGHRRLFTWRNAILGGVAAFALLGLVTAGYLAMRSLGIGPAGTLVAKGVLEERSPVLVADFRAPDSLLARAATEALRVDLSQSPAIRLVDADAVAEGLRRMGREPGTYLDPGTARELAQREGIPALITGEITPAGAGMVLTGRILSAAEGEILASHRETAADSSEILSALDALSRKLRERIGESLRSVRQAPPLEEVTTGDLEALRHYSQAVDLMSEGHGGERVVSLLRQAVERDSAFAMAWRKLGIIHGNRGEPGPAADALTRAHRHRDRLTALERYLTEGSWAHTVSGDEEAALAAYQNALELDSTNQVALTNLSIVYGRLREFERSAELMERLLAADSGNVGAWFNLADATANLGRYEAAAAVLREAEARFPGHPGLRLQATANAAARHEWEVAERRAASLPDLAPGRAGLRAWSTSARAALDAVRGRLEESERGYAEAARMNWDRGATAGAYRAALAPVFLSAVALEDPERAAERLDGALSRQPLEAVPPTDIPYTDLAEAAALAGRPERARSWLTALEEEVDPAVRAGLETEIARAEGTILLAEGRAREAIDRLREADAGMCMQCALPALARAYEAAERPDSARAVYERYLERPDMDRLWVDQAALGSTYERLGRLHEEAGNPEKARLYYAKFTELWADADPELQPRVEAARARLEALLEATG